MSEPETHLLPTTFERALDANPGVEPDEPLSDDELFFAERARAENTRRAYRSDLADFAGWCKAEGRRALPASPATVNAYLIWLAGHGAKVPTMSRRLSSIAYAHRFAGALNPVESPRVHAVWEGIRRERAQPTDQAPPLCHRCYGMCWAPCPRIAPGSETGPCCWSASWGRFGAANLRPYKLTMLGRIRGVWS